jgi:hypothetical protein
MTYQQMAPPAVAPPRGRRPRRARGGRHPVRRTVNILIALAVAAAAVYTQSWVMNQDDLAAALTSHAEPGKDAVTGQFSARLEKIDVARSVRMVSTYHSSITGRDVVRKSTTIGPMVANGIFVIATISATTPKQPTKLTIAGLQTRDERFYAASDRVEQTYTLGNSYIQPSWWAKGIFVFEVPKDALAGANITISIPSSNGIYDQIYPQRYDQLLPEVALDLNLDEAGATRLVDQAKSVYELKAKD